MIGSRAAGLSLFFLVVPALKLLSTAATSQTVTSDFSTTLAPWTPLHTGSWALQASGDGQVAALTVPGTQRPGVRRPTAYLFLPGRVWQDVELAVSARTLEPPSNSSRDVCLIFGYQDDTHYYYAHISSFSDNAFHNVIMRVEGDTRQSIHLEDTPPAALTSAWQRLKVRHLANGSISVFVDDMTTPLMTALDTRYPAGAVAFGCFDDRAHFDDVSVMGQQIIPTRPRATLRKTTSPGWNLEFFAAAGFHYRAESASFTGVVPTWTAIGPTLVGSGTTATLPVALGDGPSRLFRIRQNPPALAQP